MSASFLRFFEDWLQPVPIVWLLLTWGAVRQGWRRHWRAAAGWLLPWLILTVSTCTLLPSTLVYSMEKRWADTDLKSLPQCDAVVCLGGAAEPSLHEATGFHLSKSGDRITTALSGVAACNAKELVLSGGGYENLGHWLSEADAVKGWLDTSKLSPAPVTSLGICANTRDEATKVAALCAERGWQRVLIVTSGIHMTRAEAAFKKAGVPVSCLPCNFQSSQLRVGTLSVIHLPHSGGLDLFKMWWHEFVGLQVYRWRGWL